MPKPDVVALTGGYRRTPFLQIGADIYCDTALICDVLEHRKPEPTLYPEHLKGVARVLAQWADSTLFWAAMGHNLSPKGAAAMFAGQPPEAAQAFAADRGAMRTDMTSLRPGDATAAYRSYLRRLANMLTSSLFCWAPRPAWPTSRPTTRCGSAAWSTRPWPASWTPRPACWPGWTAWPRSGHGQPAANSRPPRRSPWPRRPSPRRWPTKPSRTTTASRWAAA